MRGQPTGSWQALRRHAGSVAAILLLAMQPVPAAEQHPFADVPFVPTPPAVVDTMLRMASVGPKDFVIDLGSGDGRILIAAAKQAGARGFGVEIDDALVSQARREAQRQGVAGLVEFRAQNLFITDLQSATVLTLYLYPRLLLQLRPRMFEQLRPGTRIVSHEFEMEGWRPDARATVPVPDKPYGPPSSEVYFWVIPANGAGTWRWQSTGGASVEHEAVLTQKFQMLEGRVMAAGKPVRLEEGSMRGEEIRFILAPEAGGGTQRQEFSGRVSGDTITGTMKAAGVETGWTATRARRGTIDIN